MSSAPMAPAPDTALNEAGVACGCASAGFSHCVPATPAATPAANVNPIVTALFIVILLGALPVAWGERLRNLSCRPMVEWPFTRMWVRRFRGIGSGVGCKPVQQGGVAAWNASLLIWS